MATSARFCSRETSAGAGAMIVACNPVMGACRSADTSVGGGATTSVASPDNARVRCADGSAGGAMTPPARDGVRVRLRITCGGGAIIASFERVGGACEARNPSDGGGPGSLLTASKFATGAVETGNLRSGASTTFSATEFPRATRMVWVRWNASLPPARPDLPACAPPKSLVCGSSSPEK